MAESGIRTPADIERLSQLGYSAFLVGERLIVEPDPGAALRALRAEPARRAARPMTRVKICGIRRTEDALLAAELGASAWGSSSGRRARGSSIPRTRDAIVAALPPFVTTVGVFVDQPHEAHVSAVARLLSLDVVQLHGHESPGAYAGGGYRIIKSVAVGDGRGCLKAVAAVPERATVLLDAHDPIKRGGTGRTIDWGQAAAAAKIGRSFFQEA